MIPILYEGSEKSFTTNGVGRLSDCISCTVTEERNGIYECVFEYPITGIHYSDIKEGMVVACTHDNSRNVQPFDIYRRTEPINGVVTFYAHHISYRLLNVILKPFTADGIAPALAAFKTNSINDNQFSFWTNKTTQGSYTIKTPSSLREMLYGTRGSILDVFGSGDYEFDKFDVKLWTDRGHDNGVTIRYGKNLIDIEKDTDTSGTYNAVVPFWYNEETGATVTLPEGVLLSPSFVNTNKEYWTQEESLLITNENGEPFEFEYAVIKPVPLDLSSEFESAPTIDQLREKALEKMEDGRQWLPDTNVKVEFAELWQTPEYSDVAPLQRVSLCDTVRVTFGELNVDVKEKVIKTVYNVLLDVYDEIELGNAKTSLVELITGQTEARIAEEYPTKGALAVALENATKLITGGLGGHVVFNRNANGEPQEILIMDTDSTDTAVNVIRLNKNGIGFSNNGYEGPFSSAWTIDNVLDMEQINVTNLNADMLKTGTIQGKTGGNSWNLDTGDIMSSDGERSTRLSGSKIRFYKGDTLTGQILPVAWGGDYENSEGVAIIGALEAKYLAMGRQWQVQGDSTVYNEAIIIVNNGLNPEGITQSCIIWKPVCFRGNAFLKAGLLPYEDYIDAVHSLGSSALRWYQVWSSSFNFATGAYINYNTNNDYIYSSKTITQASDERIKAIKPYDDRYDVLLDKLEPIAYKWKARRDGPDHVGLGARKTKKILEELGLDSSGFVGINTGEDGEEIYSVDYQELSVMLLHAYQKQKAEVEKLKKEVTELKSQVKRILEKLEG